MEKIIAFLKEKGIGVQEDWVWGAEYPQELIDDIMYRFDGPLEEIPADRYLNVFSGDVGTYVLEEPCKLLGNECSEEEISFLKEISGWFGFFDEGSEEFPVSLIDIGKGIEEETVAKYEKIKGLSKKEQLGMMFISDQEKYEFRLNRFYDYYQEIVNKKTIKGVILVQLAMLLKEEVLKVGKVKGL